MLTVQPDARWAFDRVKLSLSLERRWDVLFPLYERTIAAERFRPPRVRDFADELAMNEELVRQLMRKMARMGRLVEVAKDHFYLRETVAEMIGIAGRLEAEATGGLFTAAAFRDQIDSGRKVAIQILEFFDRQGVTIRRGDLRRIRPGRERRFG